jgi:hypothetical protein
MKSREGIPKEKDNAKIDLKDFVTADPVAAGKRQEANMRSAVHPRGENFRGRHVFIYGLERARVRGRAEF